MSRQVTKLDLEGHDYVISYITPFKTKAEA
jgi:hypothetical protein